MAAITCAVDGQLADVPVMTDRNNPECGHLLCDLHAQPDGSCPVCEAEKKKSSTS